MSNDDVSKVVSIHYGTISNCNPFFLDIGLLRRQKLQNVPAEEVFAYAERFKWDGEKAAEKLAPLLRRAWFSSALLPKLAFRPLDVKEAISFLAEEAGAGPEYREHLQTILFYLRAAGIVTIDGNVVSAIPESDDGQSSADRSSDRRSEEPASSCSDANRPSQMDGGRPISNVHPSIAGLIEELPRVGESWTSEEMEGFLSAFKATLKFIYKVKVPNNEGGQR
ncbi:hypothetical protein [Burkholderia pseudomallei]|uniref:hypothetical protein n=1 Tax=Burkholderia pseudomallei TaxID=28450 RepID=UPI00161691CB|nr:hypothetical protein [Burkholderia pseudomallei]